LVLAINCFILSISLTPFALSTIDNGDLQVQLEKSTRLLGELNAMARMVPDIDLFIMSFIHNEATLSSKIEGTQTELDDGNLPA
jgi:Fic family protein